MPEYFLAAVTAALLGWGGFTWRRAEDALSAARQAIDTAGRVELKLAEEYVAKKDFELAFERLFKTLARFEEKLDRVYARTDEIKLLRGKLNKDYFGDDF